MSEYKYFINRTGEKFNNRVSFTNRIRFLYKGTKNCSEACFLENNKMNEPPRCECGKFRKFKGFTQGYYKHCGSKNCSKKNSKLALQKARKNEELFREKHRKYISENIQWYIENCSKSNIVEPFLNKNIGDLTLLEFLKNCKLGLREFWNNFIKLKKKNYLCISCVQKSIVEENEIFDIENCRKNICSRCEKIYNLTPELSKEIDTKDKLFDYIYENFERYDVKNLLGRDIQIIRKKSLNKLKENSNSNLSLKEKIENHNKIILKVGKAYGYSDFKTFIFKGFEVTYYPHREFGKLIKKYSPFLKDFLILPCSKCGKGVENNFYEIIEKDETKVTFCSKRCYFDAKLEGSYIQPVTEITREKLSKSMKQLIAKGRLKPSITDTWTNARIEYLGKKFRSSWELCFSLLNPTLEYEKHRIQYFRENGETSTYIVDFSDFENKVLYEIKPLKLFEANKNNLLKENAAKKWSKENGWEYKIINELYFKAKIKELNAIIDEIELSPELKRIITKNIKSWEKICE